MDANLCSDDPWLVLHKVDSPTKMRYIGTRISECNDTAFDPTRVAPSIQAYVLPQGALLLTYLLPACCTSTCLQACTLAHEAQQHGFVQRLPYRHRAAAGQAAWQAFAASVCKSDACTPAAQQLSVPFLQAVS